MIRMVSVSAGPGPLGEEQLETSLKQRSSPSTADLESDSVSSSSSSSLLETNNDIISEGQWLLSRSEGQVAALPIDEGVCILERKYVCGREMSFVVVCQHTRHLYSLNLVFICKHRINSLSASYTKKYDLILFLGFLKSLVNLLLYV